MAFLFHIAVFFVKPKTNGPTGYSMILGLLLLALSLSGCSKPPDRLTLYVTDTFYEPMSIQAFLFSRSVGTEVTVLSIGERIEPQVIVPKDSSKSDAKSEEKLHALLIPPSLANSPPPLGEERLRSAATDQPGTAVLSPIVTTQIEALEYGAAGDLWLCDSPGQLRELEQKGVVAGSMPFAFLYPVLLVKKKNPERLFSLDDLVQQGKKLGVLRSECGGVGEVSEQLLSRWEKNAGEKQLLTLLYDTPEDLLAALHFDHVSAIVVWDATATFQENFFDTVPFPEPQRDVFTVQLIALSNSSDYVTPKKMMLFLTSRQTEGVFRWYGFKMK